MQAQEILAVMAGQGGVVSRRQVLAAEGTDNDVERAVRRREWARLHPGVYVDHTGPPTWPQRARAACLLHAPAVLDAGSALIAHALAPQDDARIELLVARSRRVDDPLGVRTRQGRDFAVAAMKHVWSPRVRVEHAALTVASRARRDDAAVAVLADVVQQRATTPARLAEALAARARLPRRTFLSAVLDDVASGTYSALERRDLTDVERGHGLPTAERQHRDRTGTVAYRDVRYREHRVLVELDGRLGHERATDRWADRERDVAALSGSETTVRIGWRQVLEPCRLAATVGQLLGTRGWDGARRPCGPDRTTDGRGTPAPGAGDPRPFAVRAEGPPAASGRIGA